MKKKKKIYTLAIKRPFTAHHFLIGGDWGAENEIHSHDYVVEVQLEGSNIDENNYLVDIVEMKAHVDRQVKYFRDRTLNVLPEFGGENPSIEIFAKIFLRAVAKLIRRPNIQAVTVKIWEDENTWASYRQEF